jgi:hypothetical protein
MVSIHSVTRNGFVVSWNPPEVSNNLSAYEVTNFRGSSLRISALQTSYAYTRLLAATTYRVDVRAVNILDGRDVRGLPSSAFVTTLFEGVWSGWVSE